MANLSEIDLFLETTLQVQKIADYAPNGVQVRGKEEISSLITGVSACQELFECAVERQAQLILVHHGLFWEKDPRIIEGSLKQRLKILLTHDITLMAYHLPLDCHPEFGNNICILKGLQLVPSAPFGLYRGIPLSFIGVLQQALSLDDFLKRVQKLFGGDPLVLPYGPAWIKRVAVCSGGAPELLREAKRAGADLFLSGEASEPLYYFAREEGIHMVAAGHHRTEKFGVETLGNLLAVKFGLQHQFIDLENPL
ncbi:MAG: Nif3-like dinuclear metal center hexameric protein [Magnetococcus sp. DMHC-6]